MTLSLDTIDATISRQTDAVARASSATRYSEILQLQMLREMKDILEGAYRLRADCSTMAQLIEEDCNKGTVEAAPLTSSFGASFASPDGPDRSPTVAE